jgi:hypothetical protein
MGTDRIDHAGLLANEEMAHGTSETLPASSRMSALRGFADMLGIEADSRD